jgi:hypothetical protein
MGKPAEENLNEVGRRTRNNLCVEWIGYWTRVRENKT